MGFFERVNQYLHSSFGLVGRVLLVIAAVIIAYGAFNKPLWFMEFEAQMYKDPPLRLYIYANRLEGGDVPNRDDIREINALNHYIGMDPIVAEDFKEFLWLPLGFGIIVILLLRAAVLGEFKTMIDALVIMLYFGGFSFYDFYHKLWYYGHNLAPDAPIKVDPFMPPVFGTKKIANFTVTSVPGQGSWMLFIAGGLILLAFLYESIAYLRRNRRGSTKPQAVPAG